MSTRLHLQAAAQISQREARGSLLLPQWPQQAAGMLAQPRATLPIQGSFSFFPLTY